MQRQPAVAGQFYSDNPSHLRADLGRLIKKQEPQKDVCGVIAPHAGYMYSGNIAGIIYGAVHIPETVLVLGPNHHGIGEPAALYPDGEWLTPLGTVSINSRLNDLILTNTPYVKKDTLAHSREHSLEVQLPFLQVMQPGLSISAICLSGGDYQALKQIGEGLARAIRAFDSDVLIVASSDMTHYESASAAKVKDGHAIDRVLAMDPEGLLLTCRNERITMCGVVPAAVMMTAAASLGATKAELLAYGTSGDVTGDDSQVVAYAAMSVF